MSEEFLKVTDGHTDRQTELLPELLVGAKNKLFEMGIIFIANKSRIFLKTPIQIIKYVGVSNQISLLEK